MSTLLGLVYTAMSEFYRCGSRIQCRLRVTTE
jgi:hypothetical protein